MASLDLFGPTDLPEELRDFLGAIDVLRYPPQGCTSQVAIVVSARGQFVVKRALGEQWCQWLTREERTLRALAFSGLPIPQPRKFIPTTESAKTGESEAWLVMDVLPGESIGNALAEEGDSAQRQSLLRAFGRTLRVIHQTPVPPSLASVGRSWLDTMLAEAADNLARFTVDGTPALLDSLRRNRPPKVAQTLIHGDYTLDNVLVRDGQVIGIIDWPSGGFGDPRYDLALATRPDDDIFQSPADLQSFYAGYAGTPLSPEVQAYFIGLYEFF